MVYTCSVILGARCSMEEKLGYENRDRVSVEEKLGYENRPRVTVEEKFGSATGRQSTTVGRAAAAPPLTGGELPPSGPPVALRCTVPDPPHVKLDPKEIVTSCPGAPRPFRGPPPTQPPPAAFISASSATMSRPPEWEINRSSSVLFRKKPGSTLGSEISRQPGPPLATARAAGLGVARGGAGKSSAQRARGK